MLVIGSGPIVIGQACEFDYSGCQAIKALKEEGIKVILLNSNPATVMTDPEFADRTYIEPIDLEHAELIIARERPDALLSTMGGQTALNLARALAEAGILEKYGVRLIGASLDAINKAEDRLLFKAAMTKIGLSTPRSVFVQSMPQAREAAKEIGFPAVIRPSFTLAGTGGGIAHSMPEFERICAEGLRASPVASLLIEESVLGWKEYELEVVRDRADNVIVVCAIENLDAMGVHTGDSITVAPAQTLTDKEYQRMRTAAVAVMREINVETGGSNVQFAINPVDGRMIVIEMNPRVSRSSALASKATGYPIARIATKLAVGYTLDELKNDITGTTPASFEPTLDYVVVKIPKFNFEKFPNADTTLTTSMRSVGEVMAIGGSFEEAFFKAMRSMEADGGVMHPSGPAEDREALEAKLRIPTADRAKQVIRALQSGTSVARVAELTSYDPWFVERIARVTRAFEGDTDLRTLKALGISDHDLALKAKVPEADFRARRLAAGIRPVFKRVDTCAAEFESHTPFLYSTWAAENEVPVHSARERVLILGSGPIRIGQGIEFDYCCVHAAYALRSVGIDAVMVNCNPETVSTDPDTSSRLYFEPLTVEDVMAIAERERPIGAIVQFGGQTPLKLAAELERAGLPILGTSPDAIDRAENRERFCELIDRLGLRQPENGTARSAREALAVAARIGFPVMARPSYVLGGRSMEVIYSAAELEQYVGRSVEVSAGRPLLIDRFLSSANEVDLDLVVDRTGAVLIGGVLEHVEEAGVHSGDAACCLPPHSLSKALVEEMKQQATRLARELGVVGLMNVQFAIQDGKIYVLEVNPRASRTVPFVAKATGRPLAKLAAMCMVGKTLAEIWSGEERESQLIAVKEAVFPFSRFPGVDVLLGPEMRSTGEVMGIGADFATAFAKSQIAAGARLPRTGKVFISVFDDHKQAALELARQLRGLGFTLCATDGTAQLLRAAGLEVERVNKVKDGSPHAADLIHSGAVALVINTSHGRQSIADSFSLRREALMLSVPYFTTIQAAQMGVEGIRVLVQGRNGITALQDFFH